MTTAEFSDLELRIAIAKSLPFAWKNIHMQDGNVVGWVQGGISERPISIPHWTRSLADARFLEEMMLSRFPKQYSLGLHSLGVRVGAASRAKFAKPHL